MRRVVSVKAKITYARLQERVAAAAGIPKKEAHNLLKEMTATVSTGLVADGKVNLAGLGRFSRKIQSARRGRNPQTGAPMDIPEKNRVDFLPDAPWRRRINRRYEQIPAKPAPLQPEVFSASRTQPMAPPMMARSAPPEPTEPPTPPVAVDDNQAAQASPPPPVETNTTDIERPPADTPVAPLKDISMHRRKKVAPAIVVLLLVAAGLFFLWPRSRAPAPPVTPRPEPARVAVSKPAPLPETRQPEHDRPVVIEATAIPAPLVAVPAVEAAQAAPASATNRPAPISSYVVTAGDSLWKISGDVYHYTYFWPLIYQENHTILQHPDALIVGMQLAIPAFEGRVGQLAESDFQKLADGYFGVYQAYQRHRHPQAPYYLWVAYRLRAHWVPESGLLMGEPKDLEFIRQLRGRGLIH